LTNLVVKSKRKAKPVKGSVDFRFGLTQDHGISQRIIFFGAPRIQYEKDYRLNG